MQNLSNFKRENILCLAACTWNARIAFHNSTLSEGKSFQHYEHKEASESGGTSKFD